MWEYNSIRVHIEEVNEEFLDMQGVQGWELCTSFTNPEYKNHIIFIFKRLYNENSKPNRCMEHCEKKIEQDRIRNEQMLNLYGDFDFEL